MKNKIRILLRFFSLEFIKALENELLKKKNVKTINIEGVTITSVSENLDFLRKVIETSTKVCAENGFDFCKYITKVIEVEPEYRCSFMGGAICPERVDRWIDCNPEYFRRYVSYFVNHALLAKEFSLKNPYLGILDKKSVRKIKAISLDMVDQFNV